MGVQEEQEGLKVSGSVSQDTELSFSVSALSKSHQSPGFKDVNVLRELTLNLMRLRGST